MKQLTYELIPTDTDLGMTIYEMLNELREDHHEELGRARIAIAWNRSWKPDVDGRLTLGKLRKASDLDRELMDYDFIVILNEEFWTHPDVVDHQRRDTGEDCYSPGEFHRGKPIEKWEAKA